MPDSYDVEQPTGQVRLLINDTDLADDAFIFSDVEIMAFLAMEGQVVKLAAAQALDTIASNEAMVSKVIRTQDLSTDGVKVSAELRARAKDLRARAASELDESTAFAFDVVDFAYDCPPELTEWPVY